MKQAEKQTLQVDSKLWQHIAYSFPIPTLASSVDTCMRKSYYKALYTLYDYTRQFEFKEN